MNDDYHPISPPASASGNNLLGEAWHLGGDDGLPLFSLSFSRDDDDLFTTIVDQQDAQLQELSPFEIESSSTNAYRQEDYDDDDSMFSPEMEASVASEQDTVSTPISDNDTKIASRKRKIVTPQQRRRHVDRSSMRIRHPYNNHECDNNYYISSSSTSMRSACYRTATRMMTCMQRSEATRVEILAHFPSQEDHPIAKKRRSIQHCFLHTQTSRERLLSWLE